MPLKLRADHIGSFLRPPALVEARQRHGAGELSLEALRELEDAAILEVLELQRASGIGIFSDGEYRRGGWATDFVESVDGYVPGAPAVVPRFQGGAGEAAALRASTGPTSGRVIGAPLRARRRLTAHESSFLRDHAPGPVKVTMPAASYVVSRGYKPGVTDRVYGSRAEVLADAAAIIRAEIQALIDEGIPYIQLDNPHYPDYVSEERQAEWRAVGVDPEQALREDIEADQACLEGIDRSNATVAMHLCRGNGAGGAWHTSGGYERIAEPLFNGIDVDVWLLEYDSERAGGFEPLRHMPRGKLAVLGLVTTKAGELEPRDLLLRRIEEASRYAAVEDLALSPQCGFASTLQGNPVTWDDQLRKLELVVGTAEEVWG